MSRPVFSWDEGFPNLTAACGGKINPDTLILFEAAMAEYAVFMDGMRRMFAPRGSCDDSGEEGCER